MTNKTARLLQKLFVGVWMALLLWQFVAIGREIRALRLEVDSLR